MNTLTKEEFNGIFDKIVAHMKVLDKDNDGALTREEMDRYFTDCSIPMQRIKLFLDQVTFPVALGEFIHLLVNAFPYTPEMMIFRHEIDVSVDNVEDTGTDLGEHDIVRDSYMSFNEFYRIVQKYPNAFKDISSMDDAREKYEDMDVDKRGKISPVEASDLLMTLQNGTVSPLFQLLKPLINIVYSIDTTDSTVMENPAPYFLNLGFDNQMVERAMAENVAYGADRVKFKTFTHLCVNIFVISDQDSG